MQLRKQRWRSPAVTGSPVESEKRRALAVKFGDLRVEVRTGQIIVRQPVIGFCAIYCKRADRTQLKLKYRTEMEDNELLARAWRAANTKARELGWIANSCSLKPARQLNDKERE